MNIKINATLTGEEIIKDYVVTQLEANNIKFDVNCLKIFVTNSKGADVEITSDKLKIVYNKE